MSAIKRLMTFLICLFVLNSPVFSQEYTLLTPEEIWQDGASWEEVWEDYNPVHCHYFVSGTIEHEGKTYLKIKYCNEGNTGRVDSEIFCCGINVSGDNVSLLVNDAMDGTESGEWYSFPYCDFGEIGTGRTFMHSWIAFGRYGEPWISDYEYPVFKSMSVLECPDMPGRALEIYSTEDDVYSSWSKLMTKMIVPGLGAVSCFGGLIDPFLVFVPAVGWSVQTLCFKDGQGREIFRHPHYDRIMELLCGMEGVMHDDEPDCRVYSLSGNLLLPYATPELIERLPKGIYVKRQGNHTEKILVK